jgi:hypothetical protein
MKPIIKGGSCMAALILSVAGVVPCRAADTSLKPATSSQSCLSVLGKANGYTFLNADGPNSGTAAGAGTNLNGLSSTGVAVGFDIDNSGAFHNFYGDVMAPITLLNIEGNSTANAFGINRTDAVVGTDGNGNAFFLKNGNLQTFIPGGGSSAAAFGINDVGNIVGQYTTADGTTTPGFFLGGHEGGDFVRIDSPSGPDVVNAQGINENGEIVGFYLGTDGQVHGFMADVHHSKHAQLTGTAIADPKIPPVKGEPGATFVFSQVLAVNDNGIAVGYYGDSTTSQHGFLYNLNTGVYTFQDDPAEAFSSGVEVTQITGINDSGEIAGFYSDANGVFHGFYGWPSGPTCSGE